MVWTFMGNSRMYEALRDYGDRIGASYQTLRFDFDHQHRIDKRVEAAGAVPRPENRVFRSCTSLRLYRKAGPNQLS